MYRPVIVVKAAAKENHQELHGNHKTHAQETRESRDLAPPPPENVIASQAFPFFSVLAILEMTPDIGP